ncbi:hypothetical protein ABMY26_33555 [Azospirillum sp. HJ39]|uniref:hypothetical protein n=1 Tax=Azospirillum sp. HJ39 TaxID=3159496 RepID=UPI003556B8C6
MNKREDERFWLHHSRGWKTLGRKLRRAAEDAIDILRSYCSLSNDDTAGKWVIADRYVKSVMAEIDTRAARSGAERELDGKAGEAADHGLANETARDAAERERLRRPWVWALRLFERPGKLVEALTESQPAICGRKDGVKPEAALATTLRTWSEDVRAQLISPNAPNRLRVWKEILKSDQQVEALYGPSEHPLDDGHLLLVHDINMVKVKAGNNNLPRTIETLSDYYYEFDERCRAASMTMEDGNGIDDPEWSFDEVQATIRASDITVRLREALMKLPTKVRPAFEHWMSLQLRDISSGECTDEIDRFCKEHGLKKAEYRRRVDEAKNRLRDALEDLI